MHGDGRHGPMCSKRCTGNRGKVSITSIDEVGEYVTRIPVGDVEAVPSLVGGNRDGLLIGQNRPLPGLRESAISVSDDRVAENETAFAGRAILDIDSVDKSGRLHFSGYRDSCVRLAHISAVVPSLNYGIVSTRLKI